MGFSSRWRRGLDAVRVPARCIDVELTEPMSDIHARGYRSIHALIRLRGEPLGVISVPVIDDWCPAAAITAAVTAQLAPALVRTAVRQTLDAPLDTVPLDADRLARAPAVSAGPLPSVTVAVCTRGRPESLTRCLDAIRRLDHPAVEIIVVDNSPEAGAAEPVFRAPGGVRYLHEAGCGLDRARNRAITAARGDIVAFTDDDVKVDRGWARAIAQLLQSSPEVHAVTGLVMPLELETEAQLSFEHYLGFGRGFERRWHEDRSAGAHAIALQHGNTGRIGTGANMAFRRSVFATIGGFDPALDVGTVTNGGGDLDMFFRVIKAGGTIAYEPRAVVRHQHRRELDELESQLRDWGTAMRSYAERNRLTYAEERLPFAALGCWLLGSWHLPRLLLSAVDPALSSRLVLAEMHGLVSGGGRYERARMIAGDVARQFGASVPQPRAASRVARRIPPARREVIGHTIDLARPLEPFVHSGDALAVQLSITFEGRRVATATFSHRGRTVSATRLGDVVARAAGRRLVGLHGSVRQPGGSERDLAAQILAALQSQADAALRRADRSKGKRRSRTAARR